jgi:hypothetical protein
MVGCIVITLKEKTSKLSENDVKPHGFTGLPLQSTMAGGVVLSIKEEYTH